MTAPAPSGPRIPPTGTAPAALRLRGVTKSYAGRRVLHEVDLDVAPGDCVALLGPNGAGKSTLLRIAANLTRPDAGTIEVLGTRARHDAVHARARLGYVGQEPTLYDDLTPTEHVRFWSTLRTQHAPRAQDPDADAVLAQAGLAAAAHKATGALSRGQRQRLGLALATLGDPALLLLDEPFTALDAHGAAALEAHLATRRGAGAAILLTLHDHAQARRLATRRVRLDGHRLVQEPAWPA